MVPIKRLSLAVLVLAVACSGPAASPRTSDGRLKVVAVENFWGDIVRQIGGADVEVTSILTDPTADPHTFESNAETAAAISSSTFIVENGLGYDDFADKVLSTSSAKGRTKLVIADAVGAGDDDNPHLWYSPTYVVEAAHVIQQQLAKADPGSAATYASNEAAFLTAYQPYIDTLAQIKASYAGAKVAYTERVPGYLLQAAGLQLGSPASFAASIEDGNEPSPTDTDALDQALSKHRVRALLFNAQVTSPVTDRVKALAHKSDVPVVGVSETIPNGQPSFQAWQLSQARALLAALAG